MAMAADRVHSVTDNFVNKDIRMDGKTVLITGADSGIGFETAKDLSARGARIVMACVETERCQKAIKMIKESQPEADLVPVYVDLASLESVRKCAETVLESEQRLDVLVNNAGIFYCPQWKTKDGFEMHLGVNHIGHFLLTNLLLDLVKRSAPSRIVVVSSCGHARGVMNWDDIMSEKNYQPFTAYRQSKLANMLFSRELTKKLEGTGVTCNSVHPGFVLTNIGKYMFPREGIWNSIKYHATMPFFKLFYKTPEQGAQTSIYCAVAPELDGVSGKYFVDCSQYKESDAAQNDDDAARLWKLSMQWTGLDV